MARKQEKPVFAWMDLEMTGLDPERCGIVEMAIIVTDTELTELAPPLELTVWQPPDVMARMEPFVRAMHTKSGLLPKIERSEVTTADAEREALRYIAQFAPLGTARLAGNSIGQDRRFLRRHMPSLENYLHYRQLDVSTVKELALYWNDVIYAKPKDGTHTALFDVKQSLYELRYLRDTIWRSNK